ncbi:MAG: 5'/3'-nucleotidase SurE [Planctomycetes bacterium]|mgnify:CR=1 FL=1|nr:5'/3'-nucleotidase SurE [Planctomycetota bacterium]
MRILLTNDDGILAPGLRALHRAAADLGEIHVVAPWSPQSAAGHSITLHDRMTAERIEVDGAPWGIRVDGRPADCVKLAFKELVGEPIDLVLSGINHGANVGINVLYSGTVAAAAEGAILGARAVAFSQALGRTAVDYEASARRCRAVLDVLLAGDLGPGHLVAVNLPIQDDGPPVGVRVDRQAVGRIRESYAVQAGEKGRTWYQLTDGYEYNAPSPDTDVGALHDRYISVTPLHVDLTDTRRLEALRALPFGEVPL